MQNLFCSFGFTAQILQLHMKHKNNSMMLEIMVAFRLNCGRQYSLTCKNAGAKYTIPPHIGAVQSFRKYPQCNQYLNSLTL
jgi:hypothetical protein